MLVLTCSLIALTGRWGAPVGAIAALVDLANGRAEKLVLSADPTSDLYDPETGLIVERETECDLGVLHELCTSGQELRARWYNGTVGLWVGWRGLPPYSEQAKLRTREELVADAFGMVPIQGRQRWDLGFGLEAEVRSGLGLRVTIDGKKDPVFQWPMESGAVMALAPDLLLFRADDQGMLRSVDLVTGAIVQEVWMPESDLGLIRPGQAVAAVGIGSRGRPIFHHMKTRFLYSDDGGPAEDIDIESPVAGYELDILGHADAGPELMDRPVLLEGGDGGSE